LLAIKAKPSWLKSAYLTAEKVTQILLLAIEAYYSFVTAFKLALAASKPTPPAIASSEQQTDQHAVHSSASAKSVITISRTAQTAEEVAPACSTVPAAMTPGSCSADEAATSTAHMQPPVQQSTRNQSTAQQQQVIQHHHQQRQWPTDHGHLHQHPLQHQPQQPQQQRRRRRQASEALAVPSGDPISPPSVKSNIIEDSQQMALPDGNPAWNGWQRLLQEAQQGDPAAILACSQELISGGQFCLPDHQMARDMLLRVSDSPGGRS
jgi:hypothetical protein